MLPSNEVPAVAIDARGTATIRAHVMRNAQGEVVSGTVDFIVNYNMPGSAEFTGLHIHRGEAGINGPVVINTGIGGANGNVMSETGRGTIDRPAQVRPADTAPLQALRDLLANPAGFYVNLHTTVNPGGVIRGQLKRPEIITLLAPMSPRNEVPAITTLQASGVGSITAMRTYDAGGNLDSALITFEVAYNFPVAQTFTGLHIHASPAGVNGPVTINTGLTRLESTASGAGNVTYPVEVDINNANQVNTLNGLYADPAQYYVNMHTTEFPGGAIRAQLRRTDEFEFPINLLSSNEVPALTLEASAPTSMKFHTIRGTDGQVVAARVLFDVNYRFPGEARFTGLHIHNGAAGANGPVTVNTGITANAPVVTDTGFGNIYIPVLVGETAGLATLNTLLASPDRAYTNLHTTVNPGGAVRAQLSTATAKPAIEAVTSGIGPASRVVAPGGAMAIYGSNFTQVSSDLYFSWEGLRFPTALNGVEVTVQGRPAPVFSVTPGLTLVQVPFETTAGSQPVVVKNPGGESSPVMANVQATAPAIYLLDGIIGQVGAVSTLAFVDANSPIAPGELILVFLTGLGQTVPPLQTGALVTGQTNLIPGLAATIGGRSAPVTLTLAAPGSAAQYVAIMMVPPGTASGMQPLQVSLGEQRSNTVMLPVR